MSPLLELHNVSHSYGKNVILDNINLSVDPGEIICLLGPSGCGKTTLLRVITGLENMQSGDVLVSGVPVSSGNTHLVAPEHRNMGLVFQDGALFPHMTVFKNVAFGLGNLNHDEYEKRITESLSMVGMLDYIHRYPSELSGGQQQRVALARVLAPRPALILMDEPFSGLDSRLRDSVREEVLSIIKRVGVTVIMVTHDPKEAMYVSDRICLLNDGSIEQMGSPQELYENPRTPFVAAFMGDVNRFIGTYMNDQVITSIGMLPVPHKMKNGTKCEVLIRPESMWFEYTSNAGMGKIVSVHNLGDSILLMIDMNTGDRLRIRVNERLHCQLGSNCSVHIHVGVVPYVFPVSG